MDTPTINYEALFDYVKDAWIQATKEDVSFVSILAHIKKFSQRQMQENPMRTEKARQIWTEKKDLVDRFVESLRVDLYGKCSV